MFFQLARRPYHHHGAILPLLAGMTRRRPFYQHAPLRVKQMPPRPTINEAEITESFLKGSGPGGQKINKTASAVQLIHSPTGIVVKSQATRSRSQNRKIARRILAEKLEELEKGSESRIAVKAEVKRKRRASADKKSRRKYRRLDEEKQQLAATIIERDDGLVVENAEEQQQRNKEAD